MVMRHALTTTDNPFDPFDEFKAWMEWDSSLGYDTPNYLARITFYSEDLSDALQSEVVSDAIDEIIEENGEGFYVKVSREIE